MKRFGSVMKHLDKTLSILQQRGTRGIHSFELNHLVGTTRSAARIKDLKDLGYTISSIPEKYGDAIGVRYSLVSEPTVAKPQHTWDFSGNFAKKVPIS